MGVRISICLQGCAFWTPLSLFEVAREGLVMGPCLAGGLALVRSTKQQLTTSMLVRILNFENLDGLCFVPAGYCATVDPNACAYDPVTGNGSLAVEFLTTSVTSPSGLESLL